MQKFLTHEALASGLFNAGSCCASSTQSSWAEILTVQKDSLDLVVERMGQDFASQHPKLRKPWSSKEVAARLYKPFCVSDLCVLLV